MCRACHHHCITELLCIKKNENMWKAFICCFEPRSEQNIIGTHSSAPTEAALGNIRALLGFAARSANNS